MARPGREPAGSAPTVGKVARHRFLLSLAVLAVIAIVAGIFSWYVHWSRIEKTDNAYLESDVVVIAPKISGYITAVAVQDNQPVKRGQELVRIDGESYQATLEMATARVAEREADLARYEAEVKRQNTALVKAKALVSIAEATLKDAEREAGRFERLAKTGADTVQRRDQAYLARNVATEKLISARAAVESEQLRGDILAAQVLQGRASLQAARANVVAATSDIKGTTINSPIAGAIGDRTVRTGQYVEAGTRLMTVVPSSDIHIVANFKETQLRYMRAGQPVEIEIDALPGPPVSGVVESLAPGTGAQFALLPPENATGNFTRIVQRVPVRIALALTDEQRSRLRPGLSATVKVDTRGVERP